MTKCKRRPPHDEALQLVINHLRAKTNRFPPGDRGPFLVMQLHLLANEITDLLANEITAVAILLTYELEYLTTDRRRKGKLPKNVTDLSKIRRRSLP
jgi:hypothetical protein